LSFHRNSSVEKNQKESKNTSGQRKQKISLSSWERWAAKKTLDGGGFSLSDFQVRKERGQESFDCLEAPRGPGGLRLKKRKSRLSFGRSVIYGQRKKKRLFGKLKDMVSRGRS